MGIDKAADAAARSMPRLYGLKITYVDPLPVRRDPKPLNAAQLSDRACRQRPFP
ncbi:hypothetical protein AB0C07_20540 [Actinoplanes missouriensis]|uniref:hypothetical protein n=1 Tax=Actinoplanes missouriensis TaxID=1866 RepID=UPI00340AC58A